MDVLVTLDEVDENEHLFGSLRCEKGVIGSIHGILKKTPR
jgi:hypothetical protein